MLKRSFLNQLQRIDDEERLEKEPFPHFLRRVKPLLPSFPVQVIEDWVYRHCEALYDYAWLDFDHFEFRLESWPTDRVIADVQTWNEDTLRAWENLINNGYPRKLESFMLSHGTWPVPIVVIDQPRKIPRKTARRVFREPYQLLEGHHRLAYLRTLAREDRAAPEHALWVASWRP